MNESMQAFSFCSFREALRDLILFDGDLTARNVSLHSILSLSTSQLGHSNRPLLKCPAFP